MSATRPIRTKTSASTLASTGLSMKKREIMPARPAELHFGRRVGRGRPSGWARRRSGSAAADVSWLSLRIDLGAGKGALNALGHHPVVRARARFDDPQLPVALAGLDDLALDDVVRADHQHVAALPGSSRSRRCASAAPCPAARSACAPARTGPAEARRSLLSNRARAVSVPVGEVDLRRGVVHMALVRIALLALQPDLDRDVGQVRSCAMRRRAWRGFFDRQDLRLAQGEIDVERIGLDDRRELGRPGDADQRADIDEVIGDDAVERREHLGVAEVDLGELDGGLGVQDIGRRLVPLATSIPAPSPGWRNPAGRAWPAGCIRPCCTPASPGPRRASPPAGQPAPDKCPARCRRAASPFLTAAPSV